MKRVLALACLAWLSSPLAADPAALALPGLFQDALKQNETLAQRHEDLVQAEARYRQALSTVMPSVNLSYAYLRQDDHSYSFPASSPQDQQSLKVSLSQPLFRGFREYQALDQAKATLAAADLAAQWASMQVYQDLTQAYFMVLSLEKDRELLSGQIGLYDERVKDLQQRRAIGRSRDSEVLTVQAASAGLKASVAQLNAQIRVARELLSFITGLDLATASLDSSQSAPATAGDLAGYLDHAAARPDLKAAAKRLEAAALLTRIARGGHWPSADLIGNGYLARPGTMQNVNWDLSVVATLPLFQGFYVGAKADEAASQEAQARLDLQRQQRQVAEEVRSDHAALAGDLDEVAALQDAYQLSDKSYQALKRDYNLGLSTNLDVVQALSASLDAQRALERARNAAVADHERLEAAAGLRLPAAKD